LPTHEEKMQGYPKLLSRSERGVAVRRALDVPGALNDPRSALPTCKRAKIHTVRLSRPSFSRGGEALAAAVEK
jgi:hypothetical protein